MASSWSLSSRLRGLFQRKTIDETTWDDLETALIGADFGPDISEEIIEDLHHSVTVMPAMGMYTHKDTKLMVCVVTRREVYDVQKILSKYPGTFAYTSNVTETLGNFMRHRTTT